MKGARLGRTQGSDKVHIYYDAKASGGRAVLRQTHRQGSHLRLPFASLLRACPIDSERGATIIQQIRVYELLRVSATPVQPANAMEQCAGSTGKIRQRLHGATRRLNRQTLAMDAWSDTPVQQAKSDNGRMERYTGSTGKLWQWVHGAIRRFNRQNQTMDAWSDTPDQPANSDK